MYLKKWSVGLLWFMIFCALGGIILPNKVLAQSWFDPSWSYRTRIAINNSGNSNSLTDYQVKIRLNSTNFDFSKAQSGGQDIRFTQSNGTTLTSYWIEYWNNVADSATVWVKAPNIPASDSGIIYVYYGNPAATSSSSGPRTFEFFDDFEPGYVPQAGWTVKPAIPTVRADATAAVYNNLLYVFGGYDRDASCVKYYLGETYVFDPVSNSWTQKASMPTPRWGQVAVEFNGLIHLFAGEAQSGASAKHEVYNPSNNTWTTWSNVPSQLANQGLMGVKYGSTIHLFYKQYHYEYNPATDVYTAKANVPTPRTWGTCAVVNGLIYVIGGYSYGTSVGATDVNEVYNPVTNTWSAKAPMPVKKYGVTRENPVIGSKIYVTHGRNGVFYTTVYIYDPSTDSWENKTSGFNPRDGVACGVINNKLYVAGGRDLNSCPVGRNYTEEYDPAADTSGNPWVISNANVVKRDGLAKYQGNYGFLFDKQSSSGEDYAIHYGNFATCAVDLFWNITNFYGVATDQPQGVIFFSDKTSNGSLFYYNNSNNSVFRWYTGSFLTLQNGAWNNWFPVTVIWNGSNSKVVIGSTEYPVTARVRGDRLYLRTVGETRQFIDLIRVRKYSSPEPSANVGTSETGNNAPVLILKDTSFSQCVPESACFNLTATHPDPGEILTLEKLFGPGNFSTLIGSSPLNTTHCFLPAPKDSTYLFVFKVTDSNGAFDQESSYVQVHIDQSPVLTLPGNIDTMLCSSGDSLYLSLRGEDPDTGDTLILEKLSSAGVLLPSNPVFGASPLTAHFLWKPEYSDTSGNPHQIIFKLRDRCGKEVRDTLLVSVRFNHAPSLALPADAIRSLCSLDTVCFDQIYGTDPDPGDSISILKVSGPGEYNSISGSCCFSPSSSDSTYTFVFQAVDRCGASTSDTFNLTVNLNQTPLLAVPADTSYKVCKLGDSIVFQVYSVDTGDSLDLTKLSPEGELLPSDPVSGRDSLSGLFVWKPVYSDTLPDPHLLIFQVRDQCGNTSTDTAQIMIEFNHPPVLTSQDSSYSLCQDSTVCFNHLIGSDLDPDDSLGLALVSGPSCLFLTTMIRPNLLTGFACFLTSGTDSIYTFIFELKDRCGVVDRDTVNIRVNPPANLIAGDPNGDLFVTVSDAVYLINYLFKSGPPPLNCPRSGDVNCDGKVTVSDAVFLINYLFKGGPQPCD